MDERRQFQRLNFSVGINWKKAEASQNGAADHTSVTKNISEGGVRLILNEEATPGDILDLEINLPVGKKIYLKGKVVWVEKSQIIGANTESVYEGGVQFLDVPEEAKNELLKFLYTPPGQAQKKDS